ncbi:hypothetical protein [Deinococcus sp.]|uniref:hypothetical protein n=1 Tax=Deinococcus sp. TaxID=47478 RepID=UPI0025C5400E|nr:hypothetical protein [Deinococcus sp.]
MTRDGQVDNRQRDDERVDTAASRGVPVRAAGEVLISGLDTGPLAQERENVSPTDQLARLQPVHPILEPTDEDG